MLDRQNVKKANEVCFNEHVQAGPPAVSSLVEGGRRPRRKYSRAHGGCLGSYRVYRITVYLNQIETEKILFEYEEKTILSRRQPYSSVG